MGDRTQRRVPHEIPHDTGNIVERDLDADSAPCVDDEPRLILVRASQDADLEVHVVPGIR